MSRQPALKRAFPQKTIKHLAGALIVSGGLCVMQAAEPVYRSQHFIVLPDRIIEGAYSARALSRTEIESNYPVTDKAGPPSRWVLHSDIAHYPQLRSDYPIIDAVYNMSLEELQKDIRTDGTFMAGAKWEGVWTRDISYSILLSLAAVEPEIAKESLLRKVKRERIVQDTGSGGSWPVSSDRMTWALAAWEIYQVSGDRQWLRRSFEIIRNSALDDRHVVVSNSTGLIRGESSFLDWREQTYPRWMSPVDIYEGEALGTNAVYYRTCRILAAMARILGEPYEPWQGMADRIRSRVNERFWMHSRGYYGQFLYGRARPSLSPRAEALGEALTILFDIPEAAEQDTILRSVPVLEYGVPSVYPEAPNIPPYHNRAVWPFVQAFWNLAAAKRHDGSALLYGLASIFREAALFETNKENFVADTGSPLGTEINSDRQLWSVAGDLAMVYKILFGMEFTESGIHLHPVIPAELKGARSLSNFHYRRAVLSFQIDGYGTRIGSVTIDGKPCSDVLPADLSGEHKIAIRMADDSIPSMPLNQVVNAFAPDTPVVRIADGKLVWEPGPEAVSYSVYRDGKLEAKTTEPWPLQQKPGNYVEYQVSAINSAGLESFLSEPVGIGGQPILVEAETSATPSCLLYTSDAADE